MENNGAQHSKLRRRLEDELAALKGAPEQGDYDWFFRSGKPLQTTLKPPAAADSPKAKPTTLKSDQALLNHNGEDYLVSLKRTRTADAKLTHSVSQTSSIGASNLRRTATNVATSDVGLPQKKPDPPKKKGFFKKLFGGKKDDSTSPPPGNPPAPKSASRPTSTQPSVPPSVPPLAAASTSDPLESQRPMSSVFSLNSSDKNALTLSASKSPVDSQHSSQSTHNSTPLSEQFKTLDPQLSAYLKELENYSSGKDTRNQERDEHLAKIFSASSGKKILYDTETIPPHPDRPLWPSALASQPRFGESIEKEIFVRNKRKEAEQGGSVFGSLLHKSKTNTPEWLLLNGAINESEDTPPFTFEPIKYTHPPPKTEKAPPLKTLAEVRPMKKVAFATTTFVYDPPQQIPSRNPRKGNVELMPNGELRIHKVDPEDKMNSATGIVVGGTGHLKLVAQNSNEEKMHTSSGDSVKGSEMKKTASTTSMSSFDHTIRTEDKDAAALKAREKHGSEKIDISKEALTIDKPMFKRKRPMDKPLVTLKMDELYTRCCHLREILPIPATLKQIPSGSTDPIPFLHLRNPRPSMIEIWSLTDFIRIAPLICVAFDGVSMTHDMFRIILASLMYKRFLEKVTFRNTPIDREGWKMLAYFLSMNKALKRLDITQCPSLDVNTQRIKSTSKTSNEVRMTCNVNDRSDMDWALFTAAVIFRGGLDELILTGCKVPELKLFDNLLNLALPKATKLGLAYNDLTAAHIEIIAKWMQSNDELVGIDLAFNDLSTHLGSFVDDKQPKMSRLRMLSLSNCNLLDIKDTHQLFNRISKLPDLKYLDLSGNKKLFATFMRKFCMYLPSLNKLSRLGMDYCDLNTIDLVKLLQTLPLMKSINHLSIHGQSISDTSLLVLCKTLELCKTLTTVSFDKTEVDSKFQERIGLLTMRNVERQLYENQGGVKKSILEIVSKLDSEALKKELGLPSGMSFTDFLYDTIKKENGEVNQKDVEKMAKLCTKLRQRLRSFTGTLMDLHMKRKLNAEGMEILMKLLNMDQSIGQSMELLGDPSLANSAHNTEGSYEPMMSRIMERGTSQVMGGKDINVDDELVDAIKRLEKDPSGGKDQFVQAIRAAEDPYDIVNLLKQLRLNNVNVSDLFVTKLDEGSDHSAAGSGSNEGTTGAGASTDYANNNEVLKVYDSILAEMAS